MQWRLHQRKLVHTTNIGGVAASSPPRTPAGGSEALEMSTEGILSVELSGIAFDQAELFTSTAVSRLNIETQ